MPFNTVFTPDRRAALTWCPGVRTVLGWRWPECKYTANDYRAYEDRVRDLLQGAKARAAIETGGIVWRLALEIVGAELLEEAANGPSPDVYSYHKLFRSEVGDDQLDDTLSSDELDVICGTYKAIMDTGQIEDRSWWPKEPAWRESHFDVGRWSAWNEKWFLTRLSRIRCGEEQPKKQASWRGAMRQANGASKLRTVLESASKDWIENNRDQLCG
ncbi:hypothetical protein K466DRAFT_507361 [Polyporus arcularius HHB13444]|uniref:Uncharacterized protein n=1 Tax=Polyporus arcularius HHB13444 TaxID=1314778 RepID=A0A5C3NNX9_9APHY|nr:hypothetical protein K466DRAFT_507361 [Polyporus arcularius HHB13444]